MKPFSEKTQSLKLGIYEHFKGNKYRVLGVARDSETLEEMVVYQDINDSGKIWVRPLEMFIENVEKDGEVIPRFLFIK